MRPLFLVLVTLFGIDAMAQAPADTVFVLGEIHVEATRSIELAEQAPFSLFVFGRTGDEAAMSPSLSLQDVAGHIPGLWIAGRSHLALGDRIVLRGASARSPFGTRGIQIFYDGIPLTAPDGQAVTEVIDPVMVRRMQVVRGPASTFWGNAASGTLYVTSEGQDEPLSVILRSGSFGDVYAGARGSRSGDEWRTSAHLSHYSHSGYRDHAGGVMTRGSISAQREIGPSTLLRAVAAGVWQDVDSPGSLTRAEWEEDATAANPSYVNTSSGKTSSQGQAGLFLSHGFENASLDIVGYGILREMVNPLPYAVIELSRTISGGRASFIHRAGRLEWSAGVDAAIQWDGRLNFDNDDGAAGTEAFLDQHEQVTALGATGYARFALTEAMQISAGLRADVLRYELDDNLTAESDQSGSRRFSALSPSAGISASLNNILLYGSFATSYETPTTTELVNRPDQIRGFNRDLKPERTISFEAGARGPISQSAHVDVSVFWAEVRDRLLPYQTEAGGDRTFFRNADAGHHAGAEIFLRTSIGERVDLTASYTLLRATFADESGERMRVPGVPQHHGLAELVYRPGDWRLSARFDAATSMFADDENTADVDGFGVVDIGIGHEYLIAGPAILRPFVRVENLLDARYSRSLVVNASFNRYYEPAPGRSLQAGVTLAF